MSALEALETQHVTVKETPGRRKRCCCICFSHLKLAIIFLTLLLSCLFFLLHLSPVAVFIYSLLGVVRDKKKSDFPWCPSRSVNTSSSTHCAKLGKSLNFFRFGLLICKIVISYFCVGGETCYTQIKNLSIYSSHSHFLINVICHF